MNPSGQINKITSTVQKKVDTQPSTSQLQGRKVVDLSQVKRKYDGKKQDFTTDRQEDKRRRLAPEDQESIANVFLQKNFSQDAQKGNFNERSQKTTWSKQERHERPNNQAVKCMSDKKGPVVHSFPMSGEIYLKMIQSGEKKYEGRINGEFCNRVKIGDHIKFSDRRAKWGIICEVTEKKEFKTFEKMLEDIGAVNLLPHLKDKFSKMSPQEVSKEALRVYRSFPGSQRVQHSGCVAIGVKYLESISV